MKNKGTKDFDFIKELRKIKGPDKNRMKTCSACGILYKDIHRCEK